MSRDPVEDERLGMNRPITRRDFLQGMAMGLAASKWTQGQSHSPLSSGPTPYRGGHLEGQDVSSTERGHRVRDGRFRELPAEVLDIGETYDLVVVGSGLAGLASAYVYQRERKGRARILILENNEDFGGHARRNTFAWEGRTYIATGGTYDLEDPYGSPPGALQILKGLGIDFDRLEGFRDPTFRERFGLSPSVFFDPRVYPGIRPTWANGFHEIPYEEFFSRAPLSESAKRELVELYTTRKNYLPDVDDLEGVLGTISWESFIRDKMGLGDDAVRFCNLYATDLVGLGCDAIAALYGYEVGPGFFGMGGEGFYEKEGMLRYGYEPVHRYPDGNHSIARHLLKKILPEALSGSDTMEGVFNGELRYDRFDRPESPVQLRLRSTVVRVEHLGTLSEAQRVAVSYAGADGQVRRVSARGVILASWALVAKHVAPEVPTEQRKALEAHQYCSQIYINVLLRQWRPVADIGAFEMFLPDGYCTWMHVSDPLRVGEYRPEYHPDKPTILSMFRYVYRPGLPPERQMELGRYELEAKSFEDLEREIRTELDHVLGPWGFDAARDVVGITVNRWGHGYALFPFPSDGPPPYVRGRERVGRISFAGADAGGTPWSQAALEQGWRAAHEQLEIS